MLPRSKCPWFYQRRFRFALVALFNAVCLMVHSGCGAGANSVKTAASNSPAAATLNAVLPEEAAQALNLETYDAVVENEFITALETPQSTFSIDVDTASYANVRRMLTQGQLPPKGAVRIEELVNYFPYNYPEPTAVVPFSVNSEVAPCPWQAEHRLVRIGLKGKSFAADRRPACNLVFLLDVSGSMMDTNKLPLVKQAMQLLVKQLDARDRVAIVVYAGASGVALNSTSAADSEIIKSAIESLTASGSTNGAAGIHLAYKIAESNLIAGGVNRVILCTDGDFNVGTTSESALVDLISLKAKSNVFLTVLGFGQGNFKDSIMEKLADRGNGNYAYIDSLLEARKVLIEQAGGTLTTIAKDVKIQVDFNPRHVKSYRLLGYENRLLANRDFRDDSKDAGEIGAGHTVTAFYEIVPESSEDHSLLASYVDMGQAIESRASEFVNATLDPESDASTMLTINLRYKLPEANDSSEFQQRVPASSPIESVSEDFQFAAAVVAYGMLLRQSKFSGSANWDWVVAAGEKNTGSDRSGVRSEFVQLAKTARRLMSRGDMESVAKTLDP